MPAALAWDRARPWFHWINAPLVGLLIPSGYFFMYRHVSHVAGREARR